jgi:hypothetical protein
MRLVGVEDVDGSLPGAVDALSVEHEVRAALESRLTGLGLDADAIASDLDLPSAEPLDAPRLVTHRGEAEGDACAPVLLDRPSALDQSCGRCQ